MTNIQNQAGWRKRQWSRDVGICLSSTDNLIARGEVETAKVGKMRIILTSPADFLARHKEVKLAGDQPAPPDPPRQLGHNGGAPLDDHPAPDPLPTDTAPRRRGRPKGSRNRAGHRAGRPRKGSADAPAEATPLAAAPSE